MSSGVVTGMCYHYPKRFVSHLCDRYERVPTVAIISSAQMHRVGLKVEFKTLLVLICKVVANLGAVQKFILRHDQ